jgi:DNA invertase Pin-like site-specific DNA recombinase
MFRKPRGFVYRKWCEIKERIQLFQGSVVNAHCRKFDAVIVWKFDRFARSVSHLLRALETFNTLGVASGPQRQQPRQRS